MTNTNSVQNLINEIKATRGATVSVFGHAEEIPATIDKGLVDIIDILESFSGYEVETVLPASYILEFDEEKETYFITDVEDNVIEDGFEYEEDAEERREELEEENMAAVSVSDYIEYMEELGYLEEKEGSNSYNWLGKVSNHFNYQTYQHTNGAFLVEFKAHLYGDVRGNYTDSVLLKFDNDYEFYESISASDSEEYKGHNIHFSATSEEYEIYNNETGKDMETKYSWEDTIEYIDGLVREEMSEEV